MKFLVRLFAAAILLLVVSCREKEFSVEFDMNPEIEANYRILYYASDRHGGRWIETSAPIHQGKFIVDCPTVNPTIVYVFRTNLSEPETFFYAERGDKIKITGESQSPAEWKIRGNKITDRLNEWQLANLNNIRGRNPEAVNKAVASFIEKNKGSEIGPLLLLLWYDRGKDPKGFVRLWNMMDEKLRKEPITDLIAAPDLLSSPLSFDSKGNASLAPGETHFQSLTVRAPGKGRDILRITAPGRKRSLVYFWRLGDPDRQAIVDSLRNLSRRHRSDSTLYLFADICLDSDSIRWKNTLPFDSLENVRRCWWPAGAATPEAVRLGIGNLRTFVVFGPKGEVIYKGDEISEAIRNLKFK